MNRTRHKCVLQKKKNKNKKLLPISKNNLSVKRTYLAFHIYPYLAPLRPSAHRSLCRRRCSVLRSGLRSALHVLRTSEPAECSTVLGVPSASGLQTSGLQWITTLTIPTATCVSDLCPSVRPSVPNVREQRRGDERSREGR